MSKTKRFTELDALRGLAALAVVALHYTTTFPEIFPEHGAFPISFAYGGLGVQLFFLISGFVILMTARKRNQPIEFLKARFVRLYPTYWASLGLTVLAIYGLPFPALQRPLWELAVNATMFQSFVAVRDFDGVYWSLARELVFYFLIAVSLWLFKGKLTDTFVQRFSLLWALGGLVLIAAYKLTGIGALNILVSASVAQYAPLFGLGMVLYIRRESGRLLPAFYPLLPLAVLCEGLMTSWFTGFLILLIVLLFSVVVIKSEVKFLQLRWLVWFGSISYPLYLLHQNIGYALISISYDVLGMWGARILAFSVTVFLAWAVHETVEVRLTHRINTWLKPRKVGSHFAD